MCLLGGINLSMFENFGNLVGCLLFYNLLKKLLILNFGDIVLFASMVHEAFVFCNLHAMCAGLMMVMLLLALVVCYTSSQCSRMVSFI